MNMHKKITQFNTLELKDGVRVAITYSTFKEDGTLFSNNNKISYKLDTDKVLEEHINTLFAYVLEKLG
jgi:hypothetical protein|nr:MAG TPA_asm: hypothetical protein [Caudoviricetes sp.]